MKTIPRFQANLIDRPKAATPVSEHPSISKNKAAELENEKSLERLRAACGALSVIDPVSWGIFKEALGSTYLDAKNWESGTPMDFLRTGISAEYFQLIKAYNAGRREIIEAIFDVIQIPPSEVKAPRGTIEKKSFFQKVVDLFH